MTPERFQQVEELFQAVLEREPSQRSAYLDQACAEDPSLRVEVESLLEAYEQAGGFIEAPAYEDAARWISDRESESVTEERIGAYQVIRKLGHGGMGTVYLAARADGQFQKRVAIKLVKRGMDTDFILRRFRHERQILAGLDHPHIARLLDGGSTEDGLPYFVMEFIEGLPIDVYCDSHKLSIEDRLKLFRSVCSAVHYAHQNLVVHRDLKPSNILVTADHVPKLLDFGIAKLLNPELSAQTMDAMTMILRLMTPEYGSPEQVRGEPITTVSDVYSLGVLLYELLTGHRPYHIKGRSPHEVAQVICETDPEPPSTAVSQIEEVAGPDGSRQVKLTPESVSQRRESQPEKLRRQLVGDLDNIVLMAMRKEPQRRYTSVEQFSQDIGRYLEGRPVIARKDTLRYRTGKFIKRHRAGVVAAALIVATLLGGIVAIVRQARIAEQRFNQVRALANSLMFEIHDAIASLPGSTPTRELLIKRALEYLDNLSQEAGDDPSLQRELATAYEKVGDVQGNPTTHANLGHTTAALESYRKALAIRQALSAAEPTSAEDRRALAFDYERMGDILWVIGDFDRSLEEYRKALTIHESLSAADPTNNELRFNLASVQVDIGDTLMMMGDTAGGGESYRRALAMFDALMIADPTSLRFRQGLSVSYNKVGNMLAAAGDWEGSLEHYQKALAIREAIAAEDRTDARARRDLSLSHTKIGNILVKTGDRAGAMESYRQALAIDKALSEQDPTNAQARRDLAVSYDKIGDLLAETGDPLRASQSYRQALAIREALLSKDPSNAMIRGELAGSYMNLGQVYKLLASESASPVGRQRAGWRQARLWFQRSLGIFLDMRDRGVLSGSNADLPDHIASQIAQCESALTRLR